MCFSPEIIEVHFIIQNERNQTLFSLTKQLGYGGGLKLDDNPIFHS
jgi:hypothetical protein